MKQAKIVWDNKGKAGPGEPICQIADHEEGFYLLADGIAVHMNPFKSLASARSYYWHEFATLKLKANQE